MGIHTVRGGKDTSSKAVALSEERQSHHTSSQFVVDNRHDAVFQRQLIEEANNSMAQRSSGILSQVTDNRPHAIQVAQLQASGTNCAQMRQQVVLQKKNSTGMPDHLKAGIESLSGFAMDDVKVHYNSDKPAQLQAHAYAQGTEIYLASGQEQHLPHEAWHVVQQKQNKVPPLMKTESGLNVNDDPKLEHEANMMGAKALQQMPQKKPLMEASVKHSSSAQPVQKVSKVFLGNQEINASTGQGPVIFDYLNNITDNFEGEMWFNSGQEMQTYIRSGGEVEGMGIWSGRWMNFSGKGPIVFGEQHNKIRDAFIQELNISHTVIEGASERSLTGVDDDAIPPSGIEPGAHRKYAGDDTGKALENYWVRSGLLMARFWVPFENQLKAIDVADNFPTLDQVENGRVHEMEELIRTVGAIVPVTVGKQGNELLINEKLITAKFYLEKAYDTGLQEMLTLLKQEDYRAYRSDLPDVLRDINARGNGLHYLYQCFSEFRKCIEDIGYLHFRENASPEDLVTDSYTKDSKNAFTVWAGRRELFMLKNLEEALQQNPAPLLITMGADHARNQLHRLEELLHKYNGMLVIGGIDDLAEVGATKMFGVAEEVSEDLALMYGWSASTMKGHAKSDDAHASAKIRVSNTKKPVPSYIS